MVSTDKEQYSHNTAKVLHVLDAYGCDYEVKIFEKAARRADQAAALLQCPLGAIVKSLVFQVEGRDKFLLVLVSGKNRADKEKLKNIVGASVFTAKPDMVAILTGYPVGAVPPIGIDGDFQVIIDADLMENIVIWASAGSDNILMSITPSVLKHLTDGQVCEIKQE